MWLGASSFKKERRTGHRCGIWKQGARIIPMYEFKSFLTVMLRT